MIPELLESIKGLVAAAHAMSIFLSWSDKIISMLEKAEVKKIVTMPKMI